MKLLLLAVVAAVLLSEANSRPHTPASYPADSPSLEPQPVEASEAEPQEREPEGGARRLRRQAPCRAPGDACAGGKSTAPGAREDARTASQGALVKKSIFLFAAPEAPAPVRVRRRRAAEEPARLPGPRVDRPPAIATPGHDPARKE